MNSSIHWLTLARPMLPLFFRVPLHLVWLTTLFCICSWDRTKFFFSLCEFAKLDTVLFHFPWHWFQFWSLFLLIFRNRTTFSYLFEIGQRFSSFCEFGRSFVPFLWKSVPIFVTSVHLSDLTFLVGDVRSQKKGRKQDIRLIKSVELWSDPCGARLAPGHWL